MKTEPGLLIQISSAPHPNLSISATIGESREIRACARDFAIGSGPESGAKPRILREFGKAIRARFSWSPPAHIFFRGDEEIHSAVSAIISDGSRSPAGR